MAYYFQDEQIDKVMSLIPEDHVKKQEHVRGAEIAMHILSKINSEDIVMENDVLYICRDALTSCYESYTEKECTLIEDELKAEVKDLFGLDAQVNFLQSGSYEQEPDPIPPLYWSGTETVYVYSLNIKVKL